MHPYSCRSWLSLQSIPHPATKEPSSAPSTRGTTWHTSWPAACRPLNPSSGCFDSSSFAFCQTRISQSPTEDASIVPGPSTCCGGRGLESSARQQWGCLLFPECPPSSSQAVLFLVDTTKSLIPQRSPTSCRFLAVTSLDHNFPSMCPFGRLFTATTPDPGPCLPRAFRPCPFAAIHTLHRNHLLVARVEQKSAARNLWKPRMCASRARSVPDSFLLGLHKPGTVLRRVSWLLRWP